MNFEMPTGPKSSQVDVRRGDADDVKVRALLTPKGDPGSRYPCGKLATAGGKGACNPLESILAARPRICFVHATALRWVEKTRAPLAIIERDALDYAAACRASFRAAQWGWGQHASCHAMPLCAADRSSASETEISSKTRPRPKFVPVAPIDQRELWINE